MLDILALAESELQRATMDATRTTRQLEETIDDFEKQKIRDIKHIQNVDEEGDLEVFRNSLHPPDYQSRLDIVGANSKLSLNQTGTSISRSGTLQRRRDNEEEDEEEDEDLDEVTDDES
ncbi:hypothetical protein DNTS_025439 [Danionella cerebrum]|uniref:Uncharacterized protein n=1 Tax=Danionella cerebrum TaxID=2873325 RepID=A0A553Q317_9TELE|nr:hypothetical protein DNTS_025439 [Danionella translucida]